MTYTTTVKRTDLGQINIPASIDGDELKITVEPVSEEERDWIKFQSLKGIAGKELRQEDVRRERLGI